MGKKTTKVDNTPWQPAQKYILGNLQQQDDVFKATQPDLDRYAGMQRDTYGRVAPGARNAARSCERVTERGDARVHAGAGRNTRAGAAARVRFPYQPRLQRFASPVP